MLWVVTRYSDSWGHAPVIKQYIRQPDFVVRQQYVLQTSVICGIPDEILIYPGQVQPTVSSYYLVLLVLSVKISGTLEVLVTSVGTVTSVTRQYSTSAVPCELGLKGSVVHIYGVYTFSLSE